MNVFNEWTITGSDMGQTIPWDGLEKWNSQAFLLAGVLLAGVALYKGVGDLTSWSVTMEVDLVVGGLALMAPVLGLLGLYPRLRAAAPRASLLGIVSASLSTGVVLTILGWFVATTLQLGRFPVWDEAPAWAAAALAAVFVTLALGFLLFGVVGLRTSALPRRVSLLLIVPAVMWLGLLANVALRAIPNFDFFVYVVNFMAVLTIGFVLRNGRELTDRAEPTRETTV